MIEMMNPLLPEATLQAKRRRHRLKAYEGPFRHIVCRHCLDDAKYSKGRSPTIIPWRRETPTCSPHCRACTGAAALAMLATLDHVTLFIFRSHVLRQRRAMMVGAARKRAERHCNRILFRWPCLRLVVGRVASSEQSLRRILYCPASTADRIWRWSLKIRIDSY